jgi:hypothetical protein
MKTVIINGQNHKGSTYHIGKLLADKIGGEVTEFFLPRDFSDYCIGCAQCFSVAADKCPHFEKQQPILKAMDEADLIILTSPVYVYHVTAPMKNFLDHQGHRWMVHRPRPEMFHKQAVCISTAVSRKTICPRSISVYTVWIRFLVVCGLLDVIAIFCPIRRFINVDFPTFGLPIIVTNPDLKFAAVICISFIVLFAQSLN